MSHRNCRKTIYRLRRDDGVSKYKSNKAEVDGIKFDSKKEANRYLLLKDMEERGEISDLQMQVTYELIPPQKQDGKCIERACKYKADFVYNKDGLTVVEDVKGYKQSTAYSVFVIKRKLMLEKYGIRVVEV